jgi:hypothetical protein
MGLRRIVSGGQTGADRAALDAALEANFPCGGWCPEGRLAEDGPLSPLYPLRELPGAGYRQRTIKNIESSDGTAFCYFTQPVGGTELTLVLSLTSSLTAPRFPPSAPLPSLRNSCIRTASLFSTLQARVLPAHRECILTSSEP